MRIAIIGQQDFGKATFEAFLNRGDTVAAVFCCRRKRAAPARCASPPNNAAFRSIQFAKLTGPAAAGSHA